MRPSHLLIAAALVAVAEACRLPARVGARTRGPAQMSALAEDDIASALADPQYAMDISSITEGSERETYIGQGSGVNEGTGMGEASDLGKGPRRQSAHSEKSARIRGTLEDHRGRPACDGEGV